MATPQAKDEVDAGGPSSSSKGGGGGTTAPLSPASPSSIERGRSFSGSRSPSVKRIIRELREMEREASDEFCAEPLESDLFEWMFAVRGPHGTDFEGGIYLGRITLPADYPFKPPTFMLLTVRQVYVLFVDCACARQKRERERERNVNALSGEK